jgi:RecA/RadA recombinase
MARGKKSESLTAAVSAELKAKFDLDKFKAKKMINSSVKFKPQQWIPLSPAFQEVTSVPGIPTGHIVLLRGHSDTGKTTALIEAAVNAQKMGILPVFIVTEMKWNWEHAMQMGLQVETVVDEETGEIVDYRGQFIYVDRETLNTIEDVAVFILDLLDEQKKGNLPYDLLFLWDSIGSIPCEMSVKSNKNNNEWNAGAMSTQFSNNVNQKVVMSRKESSPYTNTLVCINKVWAAKPEMPMGQPKMMNKGGFAMWYDATFVVTFGNIANAGTNKIKAIKDGKQVEFAKRTNLQIDKNHINGITTKGKIVMTPHGFIEDTDKALKSYKDDHVAEWSKILGGMDFTIFEEDDSYEPINAFDQEPD